VNVKLLTAELKREDRDVSKHALHLAAWPPAEECPKCRDGNDKWDKAAVLGHLKKEYW
jgi:hypothetical protein